MIRIRLPHRRVRSLLVVAAPLGGTALLVPAAPASATASASATAPVVDLTCTITFASDIHPPITPQLRHHSATTHGLTGPATPRSTARAAETAPPAAAWAPSS